MTREPPTAEQIAGMIGEIRRHGLGPAAIAREAGISRDIYRIEQGNSARPSYETVRKLEALRDRASASND